MNEEPNNIKEVIEALDNNLKNLEETEEINLTDVRELLIELIGTIRDMWERFDNLFGMVEKVQKAEEAYRSNIKKRGKSGAELYS